MTLRQPPSVLILGAGLAGLATAYDLGQQGYRVTLLEHPAWHPAIPAHRADAGAMLLGCHEATWRLLRTLQPDENLGRPRALPLEVRLPDGQRAAYCPSRLPAPFQWMVGLSQFSGLAWSDRWKLFSYLEQIWEQIQNLPADLDSRLADDWLGSIGQSRAARDAVWDPLSRWLTGNGLARVSAAVFVDVASKVFLHRAGDASLTVLRDTWGDLLFTPLRHAAGRAAIVTPCREAVPVLRFEQDVLDGVRLSDGTILRADWYVVALEIRHCLALFPERLLTRFAYFAHIAELSVLPEITVQLAAHSTTTQARLLLCGHSPFHQLVVTSGIHHRLTAIGSRSLATLSDGELQELGRVELQRFLPDIRTGDVRSITIHRHEEAISLHPGVSRLRPIQKSPIRNLLLAGSWTDTGWPANMEGTLVSVRRCVESITGSSV